MRPLFRLSLLALALAAPFAPAHQAGDIILRAGPITVDPHERSPDVKIDRGALSGANLGGKATMDSDTQLGLNVAYMLTDHLGLELLAATPFEHQVNIKGTGLDAANGKLGSLKHLPPTLSLVYYPLDAKATFQPYVGAGLNYTWIYDEHVGSGASAAGFDGRVMLNAQIRYLDIATTAHVDNTALGARAKVDLDVDPWVYMVGLGYRF